MVKSIEKTNPSCGCATKFKNVSVGIAAWVLIIFIIVGIIIGIFLILMVTSLSGEISSLPDLFREIIEGMIPS